MGKRLEGNIPSRPTVCPKTVALPAGGMGPPAREALCTRTTTVRIERTLAVARSTRRAGVRPSKGVHPAPYAATPSRPDLSPRGFVHPW